MLSIYLKSSNIGIIKKETIGAWIYTLLGSKYHDEGLFDYFNGSKVKAHCFSYNKESVVKNEVLLIEIRGIEAVESRILKVLGVGEEVRFGNVNLNILEINESKCNFNKDVYLIKSPIIMRANSLVYKHEPNKPIDIEELLLNSIKRKYESIYGSELNDLFSIRFLNKKNCYFNIKIRGEEISQKGYLGSIEIIGSDESKDFILNVGLGNRTGYGFGFIE